MLNKFSSDLNSVNSDNIVKVAGILSSFKEWISGLLDPELKSRINELNSDFGPFKSEVETLYNTINDIQRSIKKGDIDSYNSSLIRLKLEIKELEKTLKLLDQKTESATVPKEVVQKITLARPLSAVKEIHISDKVKEKALVLYKESIDRATISLEDKQLLFTNSEAFFNTLKSAIPKGVVESISKAAPTEKRQNREGELWVSVVTQFNINNLYCKAKVICTDLSNRDTAKYDEMAVLRVTHIRFSEIQKTASLTKTAGNIVQRTLTKLRGIELAKALYEGYKAAFGQAPSLEVLGSGYSQAMMEQGGNFYNYNFGNIKATKQYIDSGGMYTLFKGISENTDTGGQTSITEGYFRAYKSAVDGASDYWIFLKKRMPKSFEWMQSGNPVYTAFALRDEYYYTGNSFRYAKGMSSMMRSFLKDVGPQIQSLYSDVVKNPQTPQTPPPKAKAYRKTDEVELPEDLKRSVGEFSGTPNPAAPTTSAPTTSNPTAPSGQEGILNEVIDFFSKFADKKPLTTIIKNAIAHETQDKHNVIIKICSKATTYSKISYAYSLADILDDTIYADSKILIKDKDIKILCKSTGDKLLLKNAINKIAESYSTAMLEASKKIFSHDIYFSDNEEGNVLSDNDILNAKRKYQIEEMM